MATIVTRSGKGSPLTHAEVDSNFTNLNTDKLELSGGTMTGNLSFGDNDKAIFGAGSDLQIYHDGSNSFISDQGTGQLTLLGSNAIALNNAANTENMLVAFENGSIDLYYDNSKKLATTSTGIDVTGTVTADGLTVDTNTLHVDATNNRVGIGTSSPSTTLHIASTSPSFLLDDTDSNVVLRMLAGSDASYIQSGTDLVSDSAAPLVFGSIYNATEWMRIDSSGRVGIGTSSPSAKLNVVGSAADNGISIKSGGNGGVDPFKVTWSGGTEGDMFIVDDSGKVGIGTNSPSRTLTLVDATSDGSGGLLIQNYLPVIELDDASGGGTSTIIKHDGTNTIIENGGSERMRIDSSGNVGIGNTAASSMFGTGSMTIGTGVSGQSAVHTIYSNSDTYGAVYFADGTSGSARYAGGMDYSHVNNALKFFTSSAEAMRIDSSGNVGIGLSSSLSGLNINGAVRSQNSASNISYMGFTSYTGTTAAGAMYSYMGGDGRNTGYLNFSTNDTERMRIDSSGNVGIGTSSPSSKLHLQGSTGGYLELKMEPSADTDVTSIAFRNAADNVTKGYVLYDHTSNYMGFRTNGSGEAMRIDSSGNVGFKDIIASGLGYAGNTTAAGSGNIDIYDGSTGALVIDGFAVSYLSNSGIHFRLSGSEKARLDKDGNLLVGKTSTNTINTVGHDITDHGEVMHTTDGGTTMYLNRKTSDGTIIDLRKDGTTVGTIRSSYGDRITIGTGDTGVMFRTSSRSIDPADPSTGLITDNLISLGRSGVTFKDLYLSGVMKTGTGQRTSFGTAGFWDDASNGNNVGIRLGGAHMYMADGNGNVADGTRDIGRYDRRVRDIYLSGGVYLGGVGSANKLDDYEEGTFTPTMEFGGSSTGVTYGSQEGVYTKVGRLVTCFIRLGLTSNGSLSGSAQIRSLPFTVGNVLSTTSYQGGSHMVNVSNATGTSESFTAVPNEGTSGLIIGRVADSAGNSSYTTSTSQITNTFDFRLTVTYMVA